MAVIEKRSFKGSSFLSQSLKHNNITRRTIYGTMGVLLGIRMGSRLVAMAIVSRTTLFCESDEEAAILFFQSSE